MGAFWTGTLVGAEMEDLADEQVVKSEILKARMPGQDAGWTLDRQIIKVHDKS
jgi:hypothetical protein